MDWKKLTSRKLWLTVLAVALVAGADLLGMPLDEATLSAVMGIVGIGVGGLAGVDMTQAFRAGTAVAGTVEAIAELKPEEVTDAGA